jgi:hypothetical protein
MDLRRKPQKGCRNAAGFKVLAGVALAGGLAAALGACAYSGPSDMVNQLTAVDYGKPYIGMSKAEVLKCAGRPRSRISTGANSETLVYHYSGAGPVPGGTAAPKKSDKKSSNPFSGLTRKTKGGFTCTASLAFEGDRLTRVSYASKDVRSPYDWESEKDPKKREKMKREGVPTCVFSLPRCPR